MPQGSENTATRPVGAWSKDWPWGLEEAQVGQEGLGPDVSRRYSVGAGRSPRRGRLGKRGCAAGGGEEKSRDSDAAVLEARQPRARLIPLLAADSR